MAEYNEVKARSYVMWLLARRDYPRKQLEEKLRKRELSPPQIKSLLDSLVESGFFCEERFKKLRTRQLMKQGFGPSMIRVKMSKDRITPSAQELAETYEELDLSPEKQIRLHLEKLQRRYASQNLEKRKLREKLFQALQRKGFAPGLILKELNSGVYGAMPKE